MDHETKGFFSFHTINATGSSIMTGQKSLLPRLTKAAIMFVSKGGGGENEGDVMEAAPRSRDATASPTQGLPLPTGST